MTRYMLLWLEATLQSWGHASRFNKRDTLEFPTKSGVMGLLGCAAGRTGEQRDWLRSHRDLDMQVMAYQSQHACTQRLVDYHGIGGGYRDMKGIDSLFVLKKLDGSNPAGGQNRLTHRHFLQDAKFAVLLEVPADQADNLVEAMTCPTWPLYLGRKCCVPSDLIYRGLFDTADQAMVAADRLAAQKGLALHFKVVQGAHPDATESMTLNDVPVAFGDEKVYGARVVSKLIEFDAEAPVSEASEQAPTMFDLL